MAKTEWVTHSRVPRVWLLDDGSELMEPLLETTTGGRRIRSSVDPKIVGSQYEANDVAFTQVVHDAQQAGRVIVCERHDVTRILNNMRAAQLIPYPINPSFKPVIPHTFGNVHKQQSDYREGLLEHNRTIFMTAYKHPDLPVYAIHAISWRDEYNGNLVKSAIYTVELYPAAQFGYTTKLASAPGVTAVGEDLWSTNTLLGYTTAQLDMDPEDRISLTPSTSREAIRDFVRLARRGLEPERSLPDVFSLMRDRNMRNATSVQALDIGRVDFERVACNYNAEVLEDLKDFAMGSTAASEAARLYADMAKVLRSAGLVLSQATENDFLRLLAGGSLQVEMRGEWNIARQGGNQKGAHHAVIDIATGAIFTACPKENHALPEQTIHAWNEAQTIASLSGREDDLLAFASEYQEAKHKVAVLEAALSLRKAVH